MALNVTTAVIGSGCNTATASPSLAQWDQGQILQISGVELPETYKVEFSNGQTLSAIPAIGTAAGVPIPDALLYDSSPITAYIVLTSEESRDTEYWITIYVTPRQIPESVEPDPEQSDVIDQLIAQLNSGVERTEAAASMLENVDATATTLQPGSPATAEYNDGVFEFGIPQGEKGDPFTYEDFTEEEKAELVQGPILAAQAAAVAAVGTARVSAVNDVNSAGVTQVENVNVAGASQVQAVQAKGTEVIESIPPDYSDLTAEVSDLNNALNAYVKSVALTFTKSDASGVNVFVLDNPIPSGFVITTVNNSSDTTFNAIFIAEDRTIFAAGAMAPGATKTVQYQKPIVEFRAAITSGSTINATLSYGENLVSRMTASEKGIVYQDSVTDAALDLITLHYTKANATGVNAYKLDQIIPKNSQIVITCNDVDFKCNVFLIDTDRTSHSLGESVYQYVRRVTMDVDIEEIRFGVTAGSNLDMTVSYGANIVSRINDIEDEQHNIKGVSTTSVIGYNMPTRTFELYGGAPIMSREYISKMQEAITAWMSEYAGDEKKVPFVVHTDQHGRLTVLRKSIFDLLSYLINWDGVSAIFNLGDTILDHWEDDDTNVNPLLRNGELEAALTCISATPPEKQINVYGNHDTWYQNGTVQTAVAGTLPSLQYDNPYFKSIGLRTVNCPDNSGMKVVYDDRFLTKYLVVASWDYADAPVADQSYLHYFVSPDHWRWIIKQLGTDDGYRLVVVSHLPLIINSENAYDPTTGDAVTGATYYFASGNANSPQVFASRKAKTSGSIVINGETIPYDFTSCTDDFLCSIAGHTHRDIIDRAGSLLVTTFDWFDNNTIHFGLFDVRNRKINVWKLSNDNDTATVQNWEAPFEVT